jgi:uncharacterized damage-inducible protein DinB
VNYDRVDIAAKAIPRSREPIFQHLVDTYAGETNKTASIWRAFHDEDLNFRPHIKSSTVEEIMKHQLLSERRFFAEFLGTTEPPPAAILSAPSTIPAFTGRLIELATPRLGWIAAQDQSAWLAHVKFFDVERERIWVFWRRVLHSAHHRTQLMVYLRLLNRAVLPVYGPTADVTWSGADPTLSVESAKRR